MNENLTEFFKKLAENTFNTEDAARILQENFPMRTRSDEFIRVVTNKAQGVALEEYKAQIRRFFGISQEYFEQWLTGAREISREMIIKLSFFFGMDAKETAQLLTGRFGYDNFYMRNYKDFIYVVCLEDGLDWACANRVINTVRTRNPDIGRTNPDVKALSTGESATRWLERTLRGKKRFTEDSLVAFVNDHAELFGTFNRVAYGEFMGFYETIRHETNHTGEADEHQTDKEIYERIKLNIPAGDDTMNQTLRKITENALSHSRDLSRIKNKSQRLQVNRRILIIMWMLINGGKPHHKSGDDEVSGEEELDDLTMALNGMLEKCGMPLLDPRNPFDWLILNALYYTHMVEPVEEDPDDFTADGLPEDMPEKIDEMVNRLFNEGEAEDDEDPV